MPSKLDKDKIIYILHRNGAILGVYHSIRSAQNAANNLMTPRAAWYPMPTRNRWISKGDHKNLEIEEWPIHE